VVVTADDFGLASEVNVAVEQAHREGILTAASLMVSAPAAVDAVARAKAMPRLAVGLHLVLVEGCPTLMPDQVPDLVDRAGCLRADMARLGFDIFARPSVRRQVRAEIEAQFLAFAATGLALDHVNAHKHFHLHPTVAADIIAVGSRYGLKGLRVPREPVSVLARVEANAHSGFGPFVSSWTALLAWQARRAGLCMPDAVFGLAWSGAMTAKRLEGLFDNLPEGLSEIYLHPATRDDFEGHAPGYRYADELKALIAPETIAAARRDGIVLRGYAGPQPRRRR
jgi:hopanoid biosynthesis associated protein HpnK